LPFEYVKIVPEEGEWGDVAWIALTQARDRWKALVNAVLNLWVP